ncbi:Dcp1p-Dcp2p decapping enzyme complex alpha subunit [Dimargaris verticillata]|uniref:mRNA guanylyltransferase n=1 Tax=Dimargaris verticillata TaxID=2761393 RepID=A0A9W8B3Q7_9FUNG|nr:Dcp1p-Dcp2p decapping enzyme complex alpha subunit [Dimargaris verticillata]
MNPPSNPSRELANGDATIPEIPGVLVTGNNERILKQTVSRLLNTRSDRFPGAQPVSFLESHIQELESEDYFVCEKSDGIRCLVLAITNSAGLPETFAIDRRNNYRFIRDFYIPLPGSMSRPKYHNQTLFDGELVIDTDPTTGQYLNDHVIKPHQHLVEHNERFARTQPFTVVLKPMELSYGAQKVLTEDIPKLMHKNDGLIYTSVPAPYVLGTSNKMLKWKPAHENSVDFRVHLEYPSGKQYPDKPIFRLHIWQGGEAYTPFAEMAVTDAEWERFVQDKVDLENRIVEANYDPSHCPPAEWRFMRFRNDKPHANHISILDKILQSIREGVTSDDLTSRSDTIRTAWKQRHSRGA